MEKSQKVSRRGFAQVIALSIVAGNAAIVSTEGASFQLQQGNKDKQHIPLKIGHRAASMKMVGDLEVFKVARQIAGLTGVELQIAQGEPNLRDWDTVRQYKKEADRWGVQIPSLAGVWDKGVSILTSPSAGLNLVDSIRAAELLGSSVILVAFFRDNAPDMSSEASFGPVVKLLQDIAPYASDAGVTLGLENSLSPADNRKLVDLVDHRNVKVYYDLHNMAHYGHGAEAIPGIQLLGKARICQVHVKNQDMLLEDEGLVDWMPAIQAFNEIEYEGWFVFESQHPDRSHLLEKTKQNIEFLQLHCRMPEA